MLDNNTNKVIWVGVAIGVVVLVGTAAIALFPSVTDSFKPMMRESMLVTQATPNALFFSPEKDLTYDKNYGKSWNAYYYFLTKKPLEVKPNTYVYYGADLKVDKNATIFVDISNTVPNVSGNDNDDVDKRDIVITDSNGKVITTWKLNGQANLEAGETYHVSIKYQNTSDKTITDTPNIQTAGGEGFSAAGWTQGTGLAFRPAGGAKPGNDLHVSISNYKVNMVHF